MKRILMIGLLIATALMVWVGRANALSQTSTYYTLSNDIWCNMNAQMYRPKADDITMRFYQGEENEKRYSADVQVDGRYHADRNYTAIQGIYISGSASKEECEESSSGSISKDCSFRFNMFRRDEVTIIVRYDGINRNVGIDCGYMMERTFVLHEPETDEDGDAQLELRPVQGVMHTVAALETEEEEVEELAFERLPGYLNLNAFDVDENEPDDGVEVTDPVDSEEVVRIPESTTENTEGLGAEEGDDDDDSPFPANGGTGCSMTPNAKNSVGVIGLFGVLVLVLFVRMSRCSRRHIRQLIVVVLGVVLGVVGALSSAHASEAVVRMLSNDPACKLMALKSIHPRVDKNVWTSPTDPSQVKVEVSAVSYDIDYVKDGYEDEVNITGIYLNGNSRHECESGGQCEFTVNTDIHDEVTVLVGYNYMVWKDVGNHSRQLEKACGYVGKHRIKLK